MAATRAGLAYLKYEEAIRDREAVERAMRTAPKVAMPVLERRLDVAKTHEAKCFRIHAKLVREQRENK